MSLIRGRCIAFESDSVVIRNLEGVHRCKPTQAPGLGDIVEVNSQTGALRVLTPNRAATRAMRWTAHTLDPRRVRGVAMRARVESAIREFFGSRGFLETRTPLIVPSPGMEPHIRTFAVMRSASAGSPAGHLPTSPEFAMKRLLVGGLERIFQICPAFRDEPPSSTHEAEFTMLEWYRAYAGLEDIMLDTEELFAGIARMLFGRAAIPFQGQEIDVSTPWPRLRVRDLFVQHAGVDLVAASSRDALARECVRLGLSPATEDTWDDLYFRIWLNLIEPRLPRDRALLVTRYPASQAALAVIDSDSDGSRWARRFECYAGGLELGNAFEELTDPIEQRRRFIEDMALRERQYGPGFPRSPIDEGFLQALEEGLPPSGGIAVGVDRMVMLFADEPEIRYTFHC